MKTAAIIAAVAAVALMANLFLRGGPSPAAEVNGADSVSEIAAGAAQRDSIASFWEMYRRASNLRMDGEHESAAHLYRESLQINPGHKDALYYLGNMYLAMGNLESAELAWIRLAQVNPASSRAQTRLGDLYFCYPDDRLFNVAAADRAYRRAHQINQEESGPMLRIGLLRLAGGDYKAAREYLAAATASNFRGVPGHLFLGYAAWKSGDTAQASASFQSAVSHRHPTETVDAVIGEGDTRSGSRPLTSDEIGCRALEPFLSGIEKYDGASEMRVRYARLDSFFAAVRSRF